MNRSQDTSMEVPWSVEFLPFSPAAGVLLPVGSKIVIFSLGLNLCLVYVMSCFLSDGSPDIVLITDSGRLALLYLSNVLVHSLWYSYRHLTLRHLGCKSGVVSPTLGEGK